MNPYIPITKPRVAIVDYRTDNNIIDFIKENNIDVIKTKKCDDIQEQVNGHPDMVLSPIDNNTVVVAPNVYDYYHKALIPYGIKVIRGGKTLSRNYPDDVAYNVARIGKFAIHNVKYTDVVLKHYLQNAGIEFINVNQGYTKCSTTAISDKKAITSDIAIKNRLQEIGIECLYIEPKVVHLEGFDYGFIGGATGVLTPDIFMLTGKILDENIEHILYEFVQQEGLKIALGSNNKLTDLGTIIVL